MAFANRIRNQIRIATYNIQFLDSSDVATVAARINSVYPHIVCLNEVDNNADRSGNVDQTDLLATACGFANSVYGAAETFLVGSTGNAIMSHFPIASSSNNALTTSSTVRKALKATLTAEELGALDVICTHLNGGPSQEDERETNIDEIELLITDGFICGDFNMTSAPTISESYTYALTKWADASVDKPDNGIPQPSYTLSGDKRDFIFHKNKTVKRTNVVDDLTSSDHRLLVSTVMG